jgi:hypothetical protein
MMIFFGWTFSELLCYNLGCCCYCFVPSKTFLGLLFDLVGVINVFFVGRSCEPGDFCFVELVELWERKRLKVVGRFLLVFYRKVCVFSRILQSHGFLSIKINKGEG